MIRVQYVVETVFFEHDAEYSKKVLENAGIPCEVEKEDGLFTVCVFSLEDLEKASELV